MKSFLLQVLGVLLLLHSHASILSVSADYEGLSVSPRSVVEVLPPGPHWVWG